MKRISMTAGLVLLLALPAASQQRGTTLTWLEALTLARQSAPAIAVARMRVDEVRGRVTGAALRLSTNPSLEVEAGSRQGSSTDYGLALAQELELPARRRARLDAAHAAVRVEEQRAREIENEVLAEVAVAFVRAVEAGERAAAATSGMHLAQEALRIAERRYAAGDVAQLDVNLARTAVARADGEARLAAALVTGHATRLQIMLGLPAPIVVSGSLEDDATLATTDLVVRAADRPDIRGLDEEIAVAEAEQRLAYTLRWPDFGLRASYGREEGDRILLAGIGLSLPLVQRGQELTAVASAKLARLRAERDALTRTTEASVRGAVASLDAFRASASQVRDAVLPLVNESEQLALESYEAGQIGLGDLLLVRREALDARRSFIDRRIEARLAEVELRARAGVWPGANR